MVTLALDASTYAGSVAVIREGTVLAGRDVAMRGANEERLFPAVLQALRDGGMTIAAIDRVVCGEGPGSFTSLRIAASIAKGLARATGATLHAVPSALLLVAGARPALPPGRYLVAIDAMRGDVHVRLVDVTASRVSADGAASLMPGAAALAWAASHDATVIGPDEVPRRVPDARGAAALGATIAWPDPVSLASWEPAYGRLAEAQVVWERAHGRSLGR